jgi:hypothetical protein
VQGSDVRSVVRDEVKQLMFSPGKQGLRGSVDQLLKTPPWGFEQLIGCGRNWFVLCAQHERGRATVKPDRSPSG